jgi:hypothetical protein
MTPPDQTNNKTTIAGAGAEDFITFAEACRMVPGAQHQTEAMARRARRKDCDTTIEGVGAAAAYLGMSQSTLLALVKHKFFPKPTSIGGVQVWESKVLKSGVRGVLRDMARRRPTSQATSKVVYFLECQDFIKIGVASSLKHRISGFNTVSPYPLVVLAVVSGDMRTEKLLHRRFASARHKGEWFRKTPELLAFIDQINDVGRAVA